MPAGVSNFLQYNLWANLELLKVCKGLSDAQLDASSEGTFGTVRATLMHMLSSEEGYARHFNLTGAAPTPLLRDLKAFPGFDELRRHAERSGKELIAMTEQCDLDQILHLDDGTYDAPVYILLLQAVNHGIDHRSQIATMLSLQGIELPDLAGWGYNDALRAR